MRDITGRPATTARGPLLAVLTDPALLWIALLAAGVSTLLLAVAAVL